MRSSPEGSSRQTSSRSWKRSGRSVSGLTRRAPWMPNGAVTWPMTRSHGSLLLSAIVLRLADFDDHTVLDDDLRTAELLDEIVALLKLDDTFNRATGILASDLQLID